MDAIECGIVKLPRVPVADGVPSGDMPMYRELWKHIAAKMPKKGKGKAGTLNPLALPTPLLTAMDVLYGHYETVFRLWQAAGITVPPCFIVVCNNTATSKLVYDYIAGYQREQEDGDGRLETGHLALFRNHDEQNRPLARPRTLLIDSSQLESGEALDPGFRAMAGDEIARFRREILERGGRDADDLRSGGELDDATLLREVMNTVGKPGQLGEQIRCVVSVAMLTEGWDANTVTHVLGVRAFGTQLLCEQVIGRALRRQSYELNEDGLLDVEYADVFGVPFDFTAKPVPAKAKVPRPTIQVQAVRPERDHLEIRFPRVQGYRVELPAERLTAQFNADSVLTLTPDLVGATDVTVSGIIGKAVDMNLAHTGAVRPAQVAYELASHLLMTRWRDGNGAPRLHLFGQLKRIARAWLDTCLICKGGTYPAQLKYRMLAEMACERIMAGIMRADVEDRPTLAVLDPFNPVGSTQHVSFNTTKLSRWKTDARRCQVNWVILDSDWEAEFCRVVERHPRVRAYVKNHSLGFEVPYRYGAEQRMYRPDFIVLVDDGHGPDDLLHLVVEIKGYRGEDAKEKKATMETAWVPGVNTLGTYGRWAFTELRDVYQIGADFGATVEGTVETMLSQATAQPVGGSH
jgi:type III restriction enzyme